MIIYDKLLQILKNNNYTCYTLTKKNKVIGQATWKKIHERGNIDTRSINSLCAFLECQPGDILEYIPDVSDGKGSKDNRADGKAE